MQNLLGKLVVCASLATMTGCVSMPWGGADNAVQPSMPLANSAPMPTPVNSRASKSSAWSSIKKSVGDAFVRQPAAHDGQKKVTTLESQIAMTRLMERRGEFSKAERVYRRLLKVHPDHPALQHRLGVMAARDARLAEAEQLLQSALRQMPADVDLLNDLAYTYFLQDRLKESEQIFRQVLSLDPGNKRAVNNLGLALGMQGRVEESMAAFRQAVDTEAKAFTNQAYVFAQLGDLGRAQQAYGQALNLDNSLKTAGEALVQVDRRKKIHRLEALAHNKKAHQDEATKLEIAKLRSALAKSVNLPDLPILSPPVNESVETEMNLEPRSAMSNPQDMVAESNAKPVAHAVTERQRRQTDVAANSNSNRVAQSRVVPRRAVSHQVVARQVVPHQVTPTRFVPRQAVVIPTTGQPSSLVQRQEPVPQDRPATIVEPEQITTSAPLRVGNSQPTGMQANAPQRGLLPPFAHNAMSPKPLPSGEQPRLLSGPLSQKSGVQNPLLRRVVHEKPINQKPVKRRLRDVESWEFGSASVPAGPFEAMAPMGRVQHNTTLGPRPHVSRPVGQTQDSTGSAIQVGGQRHRVGAGYAKPTTLHISDLPE